MKTYGLYHARGHLAAFELYTPVVAYNRMSYLLGLTYALIAAFLSISTRATQRNGDYSLNVSLLGSWLGALVLLPFVEWSALSHLSCTSGILFGLSGALWTAMVVTDFKAYSEGEAGLNALCSTLVTVLTVSIGAIVFQETLTLVDVAGVALIVGAISISLPKGRSVTRRFIFLRLSSVLFTAAALSVDKALTQIAPISLVLWAGYFLPGLACLGLWRYWRPIGKGHARSITLTTLLYVMCGPPLIFALGWGELGKSITLAQLRIPLTVLLAASLLGEREQLAERLLAACIAFAGAAFLVLN